MKLYKTHHYDIKKFLQCFEKITSFLTEIWRHQFLTKANSSKLKWPKCFTAWLFYINNQKYWVVEFRTKYHKDLPSFTLITEFLDIRWKILVLWNVFCKFSVIHLQLRKSFISRDLGDLFKRSFKYLQILPFLTLLTKIFKTFSSKIEN